MFYTYAHYTPEGNLFYIGKGKGIRAYSSKGRNIYWKRIVAKHGKPNVKILAEWNTETEAFIHEIELIKQYKEAGEILCNLTAGGEGSYGLTPWNKGIPWSEEVKRKQGKANINNKYWVGRKHTEETIQKQRLVKVKYKFIGINKDGNTITLVGKTAMKNAGFVSTHIYDCANGSNKPHKGYIWHKELLVDK